MATLQLGIPQATGQDASDQSPIDDHSNVMLVFRAKLSLPRIIPLGPLTVSLSQCRRVERSRPHLQFESDGD